MRAQRRYDELKAKGQEVDYDDILKNVQERDYIDSHREVAPLRQADDAMLLDNSDMTIAEQQQWLMAQFAKHTSWVPYIEQALAAVPYPQSPRDCTNLSNMCSQWEASVCAPPCCS